MKSNKGTVMCKIEDKDLWGRPLNWTAEIISRILNMLDDYVSVPYSVTELRQDDANDKNGRIDVEITYANAKGQLTWQKLLVMNGELIDGITFHKRYNEWYS